MRHVPTVTGELAICAWSFEKFSGDSVLVGFFWRLVFGVVRTGNCGRWVHLSFAAKGCPVYTADFLRTMVSNLAWIYAINQVGR
ncbi:hypothetical protein [Pseudovibrio sp. Tun.PSC04-5.I4]|uniref:hypothetical protein n=1 Tax=Pseudovibrio sp. Tun.PSC04-5.I4 TaxID=1798213 RepID=UPI00117B4E79|nr:hypothetical protein [Pseudovibrio sp. Tun.PSC04-5.I4]